MNVGILRVTRDLGETRMRAAQPPEHRIVATSRSDDVDCDDFLIEGPMMPPANENGKPCRVMLVIKRHLVNGVTWVSASWAHLPMKEWFIGQGVK